MRMKRVFSKGFNFFPTTWVLPGDITEFRSQFALTTSKEGPKQKRKRQTYIVKPDGLSQGKGMFLAQSH